ncbi:RES family NAD+ phosphorylase [Zobellia alginiliquefaciens]|uniref:RES family NAD+ phosphorylase n=1 Tax=Zobellia alginiliquefaciens TaxID=3032586 RepID=UPI0023E42018|nr:RES family NAD+ phosphorylase [Zobellia alginiliquefaciens]
MIVYRISKGKYKDDLSGTGAELYGGRWNNKGNKMLYTASSRALAMAEVAVHVDYGILPTDYFLISISVPDTKILEVNLKLLAGFDWRTNPPSPITQYMGDDFLLGLKGLVLRAPSVVVPGDSNILINPLHKDFSKVKVKKVEPFKFDPRLFGI